MFEILEKTGDESARVLGYRRSRLFDSQRIRLRKIFSGVHRFGDGFFGRREVTGIHGQVFRAVRPVQRIGQRSGVAAVVVIGHSVRGRPGRASRCCRKN